MADPKHFMVRLDADLHLALRRYALEQGRPLSSIIMAWIKEGWERVPNHTAYERAVGVEVEPRPKTSKK